MYNIGETAIVKWVTEAGKVASQVLKDKTKLKDILGKATGMLSHLPGAAHDARTLIRMIKASTSGKYTGLSKTNLLLVLGAVVYLVMPFDILPDPILLDDASVIAWVALKVKADVERFLAWEEVAAAIPAEAEPLSLESVDVATQDLGAGADMEHLIASFFLSEPVLRQLILQAIPPKIRFMLRDVRVHIHDAQVIHVELALVPAGSIRYSVGIPVGDVDIRLGELKFVVSNTTSGLIASRLAASLKQLLDRKLKSSPAGTCVNRTGDEYTIVLGHLVEKVSSQIGVVLAELVALRIAQEEGRISLSLVSTLAQVAVASALARG